MEWQREAGEEDELVQKEGLFADSSIPYLNE
jgi:hypothetical protein